MKKKQLEPIIEKLRALAQDAGMTATAEKAGCSRTYLYQALGERGNPRLDMLLKVARALNRKLTFDLSPGG